MRTLIAVIFASLLALPAMAADEFSATCAYGLSEYGVEVKTDCKINWKDSASGKTYCFSKQEAKQEFLKDTQANIRKAEQKYAELHK